MSIHQGKVLSTWFRKNVIKNHKNLSAWAKATYGDKSNAPYLFISRVFKQEEITESNKIKLLSDFEVDVDAVFMLHANTDQPPQKSKLDRLDEALDRLERLTDRLEKIENADER